MANRLGKLPKLVYAPAIAPIAAKNAYCVTTKVLQSYSGVSFVGGGSSAPIQPSGDTPSFSGDFLTSFPGSYSYSPYAPAYITVKVCYPAVAGRAGTPARVDVLDNFGWDAGARSIDQVANAGFFRAQLPSSPIGVQVGLCLRSFASNYSEMQHSLVARRALYTIVEGGSQVYGPFALPAAALVEVRRAGGTVTYLVNGSAVYESATPSSGEVYGGALLYSTADYADSPEIGTLETPIVFAAELPSMVLAVSEDADYSAALLQTFPLQLQAVLDVVEGDIQFSATLPALRMAISEVSDATWMTADLPPVTLSATLGLEEEIPSSFISVTPPLVLSATLLSGDSIEFSAELPLAFVAADIASYSRVDAELPFRIGIAAVEPYLPSDVVEGSDAVLMADTHGLEFAMLLVAMDSLDVSGSADLVIVLELVGLDSMDLSDSASFGSIIEMLAIEQVSIMSHAGAARQQALQYAVNYLTGALTTYEDFDFLGFTHHEGQSFAWRKDGLYRLGAESDETIRALVDFGSTDYGEARLKRADYGFVGVRTDGECYLRLAADDGVERVYKLIGDGNQKRSKLAMGVASRYWNVRLELTDASFATVDNVELEVGVTQRRGSSRRP